MQDLKQRTPEHDFIEQLADKEHASWARWMKYLFSKCIQDDFRQMIIPADLVTRWLRQARTPYADLSEQEKQSDRDEVAKIVPIIEAYRGKQGTEISGEYDVASVVRNLATYYLRRAKECHVLAFEETDPNRMWGLYTAMLNFLAMRDGVLKVAENLGIAVEEGK